MDRLLAIVLSWLQVFSREARLCLLAMVLYWLEVSVRKGAAVFTRVSVGNFSRIVWDGASQCIVRKCPSYGCKSCGQVLQPDISLMQRSREETGIRENAVYCFESKDL